MFGSVIQYPKNIQESIKSEEVLNSEGEFVDSEEAEDEKNDVMSFRKNNNI